jgi:hypothetical protein
LCLSGTVGPRSNYAQRCRMARRTVGTAPLERSCWTAHAAPFAHAYVCLAGDPRRRRRGVVTGPAVLTGEVHTWGAPGACPGRRSRLRVSELRSRSGARCGRAPAGSVLSTSQSTRSSSSSRRNERESRSAASARCASADVLSKGNMCSYRKEGGGWTARAHVSGPRLALRNGVLEPFSGARAATRIASGWFTHGVLLRPCGRPGAGVALGVRARIARAPRSARARSAQFRASGPPRALLT